MTREEQREQLRKEWLRKVEEFASSGESQAAWCRAHNIKIRTFNYWYLKYKKSKDKKPEKLNSRNWLSLKVNEIEEKQKADSVIIKVGQANVEVRKGFDHNLLLEVVRTLSVLC